MSTARGWVRALVGLVAVVVGLSALGYPVYVAPGHDPAPAVADPADAVVALGGADDTGVVAVELYEQGRVERLVLADPYDDYPPPAVAAACESAATDPAITCFDPDPRTTRGEARAIRDLAVAEGWDHVVVVAPSYQVNRARYVVGRCFDGELSMVDARARTPLLGWPWRYVYQSAGFARATLTQRGC